MHKLFAVCWDLSFMNGDTLVRVSRDIIYKQKFKKNFSPFFCQGFNDFHFLYKTAEFCFNFKSHTPIRYTLALIRLKASEMSEGKAHSMPVFTSLVIIFYFSYRSVLSN